MQLRSTDVISIPSNIDVLYLKKNKVNGLHPILIAERRPYGWETYSINVNGDKYGFSSYSEYSFIGMLRGNHFLISDIPMKDSQNFNYE